MSGCAIRVEGLGKQYRVGHAHGPRTLREDLVDLVRAPFRRAVPGAAREEDGTVWALRDVSLEVQRGEVVGIIGGNGAGKSTLLKILSRIVSPTEGWARIEGRVGSLLEAGTGFHSELTGRENVYMSGAILGMRRAEIARKFDEIVAFADIGPFLDTPVKRYSSGMQVRLAFAVAAHLEPEVLIVDEVLAVGDAEFQKKCLGRMQDVSRGDGRTVLFVSHNMDAVQRLCDRAVLVERGRLVASGTTASVVGQYLARANAPSSAGAWIDLSGLERTGSGVARTLRARYWSDLDAAGCRPYSDGPLTVRLAIEATAPCTIASLAVTLYDMLGTKLVNADTIALGRTLRLEPGEHHITLRIPELHLNPGVYLMGFWLAGPLAAVYDFVPAGFELEVVAQLPQGLGRAPGDDGLVTCRLELLDSD
jgi:ABC-type polysaccharide/polyol phosphate transport system ATPase subunit